MYFFAMKNLFQKIPVELPKPASPKEENQSLLHYIESGWYMKKLSDQLPRLKNRKLRKKEQKKED